LGIAMLLPAVAAATTAPFSKSRQPGAKADAEPFDWLFILENYL